METVSLYGKLTRQEIIELEGYNDFDLMDYEEMDEELPLEEFLETIESEES